MGNIETEPKFNILAECLVCGMTFPNFRQAYPDSLQTQVNFHLLYIHDIRVGEADRYFINEQIADGTSIATTTQYIQGEKIISIKFFN